MLSPGGGKESFEKARMDSSPSRQPAYPRCPSASDPPSRALPSNLKSGSNSRPSRTNAESQNLEPNYVIMDEKEPEKPNFSWSRIRESPAFAAHLSNRDTGDRLTYSAANRLSPINVSIEIEALRDKIADKTHPEPHSKNYATPRPTSSVYEDDTLAPPSPIHRLSSDQDTISLPCPEKQHINYSRPSSPRSYRVPRAPDSTYENVDTFQPPTPTYQKASKDGLSIEEAGARSTEERDWEKSSFDFPPTSASPDCTPRISRSPSVHHHPGRTYQPPTTEKPIAPNPSPSSPAPRPPLYQPRKPRRAGRRKLPSFPPSWVFPRMRKKYRKRLSGALFALLFVGSLGTGIGFLIVGIPDNRRIGGVIEPRIPWMIAAGGSILGLHGAFMITMLLL